MAPIRITSSHFSPDTGQFIQLLSRHDVRYLMVGGEAVIFHGHSRLTGGVDFFFHGEAENARRLFVALSEFWEGEIPGVKRAEELSEPGLVVQFGVPPNRIDILNSIEGVEFSEAWSERVTATVVSETGEIPLLCPHGNGSKFSLT
jgi:hypothetical protein